MCNPRRIQVTITRLLNEAWKRVVSRQVELHEEVTGQARVVQPLGTTIGLPALRALEAALASDRSGWRQVEEGYRHDVDGGYVTYLVDQRALEIVAVSSATVTASGEAVKTLEGRVTGEVNASALVDFYDDSTAATKRAAEARGRTRAARQIDKEKAKKVERAQREAENESAADIEIEAHQIAEERLQEKAAQSRAALAETAKEHLETVGLRARQMFNRVLAQAYRDSILAYARKHGAQDIQCNEGNDAIEIEFSYSG
jgi:hypothetical protein